MRFFTARSSAESVVLGHNHFGDLSPASNKCAQLQGDLIGQGTHSRTHPFGEAGQYHSIDVIGLGQLTRGFGEISDLTRIDHHHRQFGTGQCPSHPTLHTTGGFQHDQVFWISSKRLTKSLIPRASFKNDSLAPDGRTATSSRAWIRRCQQRENLLPKLNPP